MIFKLPVLTEGVSRSVIGTIEKGGLNYLADVENRIHQTDPVLANYVDMISPDRLARQVALTVYALFEAQGKADEAMANIDTDSAPKQ